MATFAASWSCVRRAGSSRGALLASLMTCGLFAVSPASAALGQRADSVRADRAHLSAALASHAEGAHTVHTLTLPNGGVVHEYENAEGVVFAVAWRAPGRPDLRQLLGGQFATMQADTVRTGGPHVRAPLRVERDELVVRSGGHPGAFWGLAYLPGQVPAGFTGQDLR